MTDLASALRKLKEAAHEALKAAGDGPEAVFLAAALRSIANRTDDLADWAARAEASNGGIEGSLHLIPPPGGFAVWAFGSDGSWHRKRGIPAAAQDAAPNPEGKP